ncbi:MAG TPA: hypothetical protein VM680_12270 [Verrucomicrobiae bacterium]|nr:hypothetical protein [Verrucomicrobiae bacterium]
MKFAPLADAALAILPAAAEFAAAPETPSEPFGEVLDEATEDLEGTATKAEEKKPKDDAPVISIVAYFCPPPQIEPVQVVASQGVDAQKTVEETPAQESAPANASVTADKTAEGAIRLNPKLFEPISGDTPLPQPAAAEQPKAAETQRTAVANASHGTLVAQLENRVKNSGKSAEIAPAIEQKMPVRDVSRRVVVETARIESFHAEKQPSHLLNAEFEVGAAEIIPVKTVDAARLVETIRTEVANVRHLGETNMTVVLRPDSGTQLSLNVSIGRDGTIHAQARCERGDFQTLNAQWPQLQQSLAAHGIRIADLSNQNNPQQHHHSSADQFQNFDRGQNPQQREQAEVLNFEEQFGASRNKTSLSKPQPPTASVAHAPRHWQSWA